MEELGVQALQCLLEDGIGRSSFKTKSLKKVGIDGEIGNKVTIPKSHIELESQEDKESWEWEVRRSSKGGSPVRYHIAKTI